jgi:hypothetical protein
MIPLPSIACVFATIALLIPATAGAAPDLQAGVATVDITPPVTFRMSGYFNERLSTGVKDPLRAKAIVFRQGDASAALVFCDLIGIPLDVSQAARHKASEATGISTQHIAIACTHSHTGPLYYGALRDHFHNRAIAQSGNDRYEKIDYSKLLVERLADAIVQANAAIKPVRLHAGFASERRLSFNRRFHMRDGSVRFNPGVQNPDIIRPAGPIDPQVGTILVSHAEGEKLGAAIVSFALHLDTTGGTEYSADYPKFIEDRMREVCGPEFTVLFGAGTCGDINHIDVTNKQRRSAEQIGNTLAETIAGAMSDNNTIALVSQPALAVRSASVEVALQKYTDEEISEARKNMELIGGRELPFLDQVKACTIMDLEKRGSKTWPLEVQVFRLSDETAIVTLPGEVFVELGLAIKAASPFKTTLVIELTNDCPAYIPTKKAFAEGSYEIVNSRVESGGGEKMVEAAILLLKELQ